MTIRIEADAAPAPEMREEVRRGLRAYNLTQQSDEKPQGDYAIYVRDDASGEITGGLWASYFYDWMFIELLSVPEVARGKGTGREMIEKAEAHARGLGLTGIWLDTFAFQARGFYEKLGYEIFGTLEDHPKGSRRFFLRKYLT